MPGVILSRWAAVVVPSLVWAMALLSGVVAAESAAPKPRVTHLEASEALPFPGHLTRQVVRPWDTPAGVSMLELTMAPRSLGAPPHTHRDEDEYFVVLEGAVEFLTGDEQSPAPAGSVAVLPRGHLHGFWNPHEQPARLLLMVAPGQFHGFFDEVVMRIREANADTPERIGAILAEAAAARNVVIEMDRLPETARALLAVPEGG